MLAVTLATGARADSAADCFSEDLDRRIEGCTALIEQGDQNAADLSYAYAMRALAYSLKGRYETAIRDYDMAISMKPDFAVALNNRAWALFRWGKAAEGLPDVETIARAQPGERSFVRHPRPHPARRWAIPRRRCATTTGRCGTAARE